VRIRRNWSRWECKMVVVLLWKTGGQFLEILKIKLPYNPEILPLDIHPRKPKSESTQSLSRGRAPALQVQTLNLNSRAPPKN
jgi:hypothetical protein